MSIESGFEWTLTVERTRTYLLKIKDCMPETLPMERLAEYMKQFALLLGEKANVHFDRIERASTGLRAHVDESAIPKVDHRIREVANGNGPPEAMQALKIIDWYLANDNTSGSVIRLEPMEEVIPILGADRPREQEYGPISQSTTLVGKVIRVGGRRQEVPVHIETQEKIETNCVATRALAQELGKYLFVAGLRFSGNGKWRRNSEGIWELTQLHITGYELLNSSSLLEAAADLQAVEPRNWTDFDPWDELSASREGGEE